MDRPRNNQFLEPEPRSGMIGWAVKQLAIWLVGGMVVYSLVVNHQWLSLPGRDQAPASAPPGLAASRVDGPPVDADSRAQESHAQDSRALGQVVPPATYSLTLRARPDGYAYVRAMVNGVEMSMAFDTGASTVALTPSDAIKAGVAGNLNYSIPMGTANGRNMGAPVVLREIRIGQLVIPDVNAIVMPNLNQSLLGQTFLNRLHSYQMQNNVLTLTWQQ
jgi:clan AA aspartic protease (TIGR02281 family)